MLCETFVRVVDCKYCGQYELPLDIESLSPVFVRKLRRKGIDGGIEAKDVAKVREKQMQRLILSGPLAILYLRKVKLLYKPKIWDMISDYQRV